MRPDDRVTVGRGSGASGTRTHDLSAASRTLSQLSYSPESVVLCKVNAGPLAVSGWIETQVQLPLTSNDVDWDQKRGLHRIAVDRNRIDLVS